MRAPTFIAGGLVCAVIFVSAGCTSVAKPKSADSVRDLQLQKSVTLAAGRFSQILDALQAGKTDQAKKDLDWWLDSAILELSALEERDPQEAWGEIAMDSDSELKMKTFYKRIAQYRKSHPRLHSVPLDSAEQKRIDAFVEKYQ